MSPSEDDFDYESAIENVVEFWRKDDNLGDLIQAVYGSASLLKLAAQANPWCMYLKDLATYAQGIAKQLEAEYDKQQQLFPD